MALKKRKLCKSRTEQLYMLEILVERVDLGPERSTGEWERNYCPMVRVEFIDLTPVDITAEEFIEAVGGEGCKNKESRSPDERASRPGKSCLFTRAPSNLIRSIKSTPLSVEVYRIPRTEDRNSRDDGPLLLCAATEFLPGCFCDRVAEAKGKPDGLPEPYTLKKVYTLADERGVPCGSALIYLRLSCFGSSIIPHLALREKSVVFQGLPLGEKFRCTRQPDGDASDETDGTRYARDTALPPSQILRATHSGTREDQTGASAALTRPRSPPRVSIDQPDFEKLTSAEKLNDRRYRGLVYAAYPNEPTCSCLPASPSRHPLVCRSGCLRSCCMALRNPEILQSDAVDGVPSLAALPTGRVSDPYLKSSGAEDYTNRSDGPTRMKGGGEKEDSKQAELPWNDKYTWHGDNINLRQRLTAGSEYAYAPSEVVTTVLYEKSKETSAAYKPRPRSADGIMTGCNCPGKDPSSRLTGTTGCMKKPCVGADCMIRAFKEAQNFVDNLGKVPGLAGLNLMDPSESPYFRRDVIDRQCGAQEMPRRGYSAALTPSLQYTAPYNTDFPRAIPAGVPAVSYAPGVATTGQPGRGGGVVREAIPTLPDASLFPLGRSKRKEDKKEERAERQKEADVVAPASSDVEVGPCGEPRCKSRRKTRGGRPSRLENATESQEKTTVQSKSSPSTIPVKSVSGSPSERGRRPRTKASPGPDGDRDPGKAYPVKVSRRVMRYVYKIGEVYPGINYGHKNCVDPRMRVPANMGWLWNTTDTVSKLKPRIGWKPGAIGRYLYELLKEAKAGSLAEDSRARSVPSRTAVRRKAYKPMGYPSAKQTKEGEKEVEPPPTLHIHRKDGTYYVTMYPIKGETTDDAARLEEPAKPLQFKITKSRNDASVASSSTASDMEIEFSPPAAVNRYRKKPDVVHVDTQVKSQEILDALKPVETPRGKAEKKGKTEKKEAKGGKDAKGKKEVEDKKGKKEKKGKK